MKKVILRLWVFGLFIFFTGCSIEDINTTQTGESTNEDIETSSENLEDSITTDTTEVTDTSETSDTTVQTDSDLSANSSDDSSDEPTPNDDVPADLPDGFYPVKVTTLPVSQEITLLDSSEYHNDIVDFSTLDLTLIIEDIMSDEDLIEIVNHILVSEYNFTKDQIGEVVDPSSIYVMTNKLNHLPADYAPENLVIPDVPACTKDDVDSRYVRDIMATALESLFESAVAEDLTLYCNSGYRSYNTQVYTYNSQVDSKGQEAADRVSARAGHSEHQTGLAMDVTCEAVNFHLEEEFGELPEGIFIAEHAHEYGLIIRYPEGFEAIVGYSYESWHLRYVGVPLATFLYEHELTLDEFYYFVQTHIYPYVAE